MANDYSVSLFYWDKKEEKNGNTYLILNDGILGLKEKVEEWVETCKVNERNPLSISVRYISGNRFGGSARNLLDCTIHEFFNMYK